MFAQSLTIYSAMLISEVDTNGDSVKAAYSYTDSNNKEQTEEFVTYDLCYDPDLEDYFFERNGESYYLSDFHNAYGYGTQETQ